MATLKPLSDRIIVKALSAEEKTQQGEVLAVGPGKLLDSGKLAPVDISVGDRVYYGKYSGTEVKLDGQELVVLRQDDVLGVVES